MHRNIFKLLALTILAIGQHHGGGRHINDWKGCGL